MAEFEPVSDAAVDLGNHVAVRALDAGAGSASMPQDETQTM